MTRDITPRSATRSAAPRPHTLNRWERPCNRATSTASGGLASLSPEGEGGTTLAPARPDQELDEGDHDRMAHIVLEGYTPTKGRKKGEFVSAGPERRRRDRQRHRRACPLRQGVGAGPEPPALRPVPDVQGDRPVHGLEGPGQLGHPAHSTFWCRAPMRVMAITAGTSPVFDHRWRVPFWM